MEEHNQPPCQELKLWVMVGTRQRHLSEDFEKDHGVGLSDPTQRKK